VAVVATPFTVELIWYLQTENPQGMFSYGVGKTSSSTIGRVSCDLSERPYKTAPRSSLCAMLGCGSPPSHLLSTPRTPCPTAVTPDLTVSDTLFICHGGVAPLSHRPFSPYETKLGKFSQTNS
jgi:hypothetical protein